MCKASKYLNEMNDLLHKIKTDYELLSQKQSEYDTMLSDHYHKIETMKFNACEGFYLTKQLQEILRKRRIVKNELSKLNTLKQMLDFNKIHNSINKSKQSIIKADNKSKEFQHNWEHIYTLEEVFH